MVSNHLQLTPSETGGKKNMVSSGYIYHFAGVLGMEYCLFPDIYTICIAFDVGLFGFNIKTARCSVKMKTKNQTPHRHPPTNFFSISKIIQMPNKLLFLQYILMSHHLITMLCNTLPQC